MDREAGFLTAGQREFLTDRSHSEKTSGDFSTKRSRLRGKIRGAVYDLSLLDDYLPPSERKQTFAGQDVSHPKKPGQQVEGGKYEWDVRAGFGPLEFVKGEEELVDALADTVAFVWAACYDAQVSPADVFETAIEDVERGAEVEITTIHNTERRDVLAERGREKMANGEPLEDPEASALVNMKEEIVPNALVFDYLRGNLEQYELPPFAEE